MARPDVGIGATSFAQAALLMRRAERTLAETVAANILADAAA